VNFKTYGISSVKSLVEEMSKRDEMSKIGFSIVMHLLLLILTKKT